ncbi:diacylglycerol/polyprenol kinase family protein [Borreliella yangtzensis]|uniref:Dolichol kinase n=1 Tax=Borreliella yangtzensis TaxID=683292 RepID=A0ABR6P985_9SPIR|nr:diacylglycerol/polyprenol kinase family protein [Borreliella yangtzensis]MBB6042838.1 dolichol kinase [Borreliella yangtzensis]WKC73383.1 SEC59/DGK1/VTE5 family protein [Borreliella yangtzensis]WKC74300.1 SEC59/DGK1/VTE5 family protein [Borreliella yangtzensis]
MFDVFKRTIFREDIKYEIFRKFFHIFSLIILVFYGINFWIGLVSNILFMILYLSSEVFRITKKKILFFKNISNIILKSREILPNRVSFPPVLLFLGILTSYCLVMGPFNYIGIFSVCLGDGFASLVGKLIPSFKLVNGKTVSGSFVVFCVTFFSYYYFFPYLTAALILGILAVLVELFDAENYDNLFLPLVVSTSSYFLTFFFYSQ